MLANTFRVIKEHLSALGYHIHTKVLNALDYGVPQNRERIFIVGFLDDVKFKFPDPVPVEERKTFCFLYSCRTCPRRSILRQYQFSLTRQIVLSRLAVHPD
ncbi:MAG: hypothetical protein E7470_01965 [Ruminococcaceae bacterium]|nr:hypothetical protein [Oscillospiraceae bacterium]